jgi:hypothetical protein
MPCPTVYNSVLLNRNGIIQQVKTTFLSSRSMLQEIEKYVTLYTFSPHMEGQFTQGYVPYRFEVDDAEPDSENHSALQEIILAGSSFINRQNQLYYSCYAELVIVFTNKHSCNLSEIKDELRSILNYYNGGCSWTGWKAFAWRRITRRNTVMVAVSLEK